jgi:hypothetical protein
VADGSSMYVNFNTISNTGMDFTKLYFLNQQSKEVDWQKETLQKPPEMQTNNAA